MLGPVASLGRWRRLALAAAAERLHETAFLVEEARRYAAQLPSSATDMSSSALDRLLARRDAQVIALVVDAVATARSRGLQSLLAPIHAAPDAAFAPILAAVVRRRYGTHADGEPVAWPSRWTGAMRRDAGDFRGGRRIVCDDFALVVRGTRGDCASCCASR